MSINKPDKLISKYFSLAKIQNYIELSGKMLKELSTNYTIDTQSVSMIMQYLNTNQYKTSTEDQQSQAAKLFLAFNSLRTIIIATFSIISQNELYQLLCMVYEDVISQWKQYKDKHHILYCYILSKQFYQLLARTRHTVPLYFGWAAPTLKYLITEQYENLQENHIDQQKMSSLQVKYLEDIEQINPIYIMHRNISQDSYENNLRVIYLISAQIAEFIQISNKKQLVKCQFIQQIKKSLQFMLSKMFQNSDIKKQVQAIIETSFTDSPIENQPIYIEKTIQFRLLQPRILSQQPATKIKLLKKKRNKLKKKIENEFRGQLQSRIQQQQVIEDTRKQKIARQQKKQIFIMQKQTEQAKKMHKQVKRFKQIHKKKGGGGNKK